MLLIWLSFCAYGLSMSTRAYISNDECTRIWQDSCCYSIFAGVLVLILVEVWILFVCLEYGSYCCRITTYEIRLKLKSYLSGIYSVIFLGGKLSEFNFNDQILQCTYLDLLLASNSVDI